MPIPRKNVPRKNAKANTSKPVSKGSRKKGKQQKPSNSTNSRILEDERVSELSLLVEEATRATGNASTRFVEPALNTLRRAKAKRHHIVFGRRGSGKSSMLGKARSDLSADDHPVAFIDLETFKEHSYPDVLLSVLIETLREFQKWFTRRSKEKNVPEPPELMKSLGDRIKELRDLLHKPDDSNVTEIGTDGMGSKESSGTHRQQQLERTSTFKHSKTDYLMRHIMDFREIIEEVCLAVDDSAYIFLDDLYHLRRNDQARVIDYFHRVAKGLNLWLKIGTIKHRTQWYRHTESPVGMKLGDDCDEINLDITLENYKLAKDFLYKILDQLIAESGLKGHSELLTDGGVNRLVLASGGVARDFLTIFRKSIIHALERGAEHHRGGKVGAEDVNAAAGDHDSTKRDELIRDATDAREQLEAALGKVQAFCISKKVNVLLIARDKETPGTKTIGELLDLRFLHLADSRVTVRDNPGALHTCYLLDVSQYTGARKRRDMEMVDFWERGKLDRIRRTKFVFNPDTSFINP